MRAGREVVVLIKHGRTNESVTMPGPMTDVLHGGAVCDVELPPRGVAVLVRPAPVP